MKAEHWRVRVALRTFANIVERYLGELGSLEFPLKRGDLNGTIHLSGPKFPSEMASGGKVDMVGYYSLYDPDSVLGVLDWTRPAISFDFIPLVQEEFVVTIRCQEPILLDFFEAMTGYIANVLGHRCQGMQDPRKPPADTSREAGESARVDNPEVKRQRTVAEDAGRKPWERISHRFHRKVLRLWHSGYSAREIAEEVDRTAKTITNLISGLRQLHGTGIVPFDGDRETRPRTVG